MTVTCQKQNCFGDTATNTIGEKMTENRYQQYKKAYFRDKEKQHGIEYVVRNREKLKKDFDRFADEIL